MVECYVQMLINLSAERDLLIRVTVSVNNCLHVRSLHWHESLNITWHSDNITLAIIWKECLFTHFWPFIYIFQRAVTQSKIVRLTRFFLYRFRISQWSFSVLSVLSLSKNHEAKMSKNWISWRPSWIFGGHLGLTMGNFLTLYYIYDNDHLYQFW